MEDSKLVNEKRYSKNKIKKKKGTKSDGIEYSDYRRKIR